MNAKDLLDIFLSPEFKQDLAEMSSYLASIKQERPIVYCLAKHLWKRRRVFQLEDKHRDLVVDGLHLEFNHNFDCDTARLEDELERCEGKPLNAIPDALRSGWSVIHKIYEDMCVKRVHDRLADIFVWVICSRDLREVSDDARKRICWFKEQWKWNQTHPYSDQSYMSLVDRLLDRIQVERSFSVLNEIIETKGDFPSMYHFRICEFPKGA
jgi:hypothetical protein